MELKERIQLLLSNFEVDKEGKVELSSVLDLPIKIEDSDYKVTKVLINHSNDKINYMLSCTKINIGVEILKSIDDIDDTSWLRKFIESLICNLEDKIKSVYFEEGLCMGELLAAIDIVGLDMERNMELYIKLRKWSDGDKFFIDRGDEGGMEEL